MGVGRIFPGGGPLVDFSKIFSKGAESGEICFPVRKFPKYFCQDHQTQTEVQLK